MARFSETNVSLRLNRIPTGSIVDLHNFDKRGEILASDAKLIGWFDKDGNAIDAPKAIKSMDKENTMKFEVTAADNTKSDVVLIKDPNGFGAMFLKSEKEIDGVKSEVLHRITAYASKELVDSTRVVSATKKAEEATSSGIEVETNEALTEE